MIWRLCFQTDRSAPHTCIRAQTHAAASHVLDASTSVDELTETFWLDQAGQEGVMVIAQPPNPFPMLDHCRPICLPCSTCSHTAHWYISYHFVWGDHDRLHSRHARGGRTCRPPHSNMTTALAQRLHLRHCPTPPHPHAVCHREADSGAGLWPRLTPHHVRQQVHADSVLLPLLHLPGLRPVHRQ